MSSVLSINNYNHDSAYTNYQYRIYPYVYWNLYIGRNLDYWIIFWNLKFKLKIDANVLLFLFVD